MKTCINTFLLLFLVASVVTGCVKSHASKPMSEVQSKIIGEWVSESVIMKDPLFKGSKFENTIRVTFGKQSFKWVEYNFKGEVLNVETYSTGTYGIEENNKLIVYDEIANEEMVTDITLELNQLTISTDDGFVFKFKRIF